MKVLQINAIVNSGSTGRIAEDIGKVLIANGHESYIAYGRGMRPSNSQLIRIGNQKDILFHVLKTRLFDRHGFGSKKATIELIQAIDKIKPDVIGLHCIHGYYINIKVLFEFLQASKIPVVWTQHDAWAFTGHCAYYDSINCEKWKTGCYSCPQKAKYPSSYVLDQSKRNYQDKKKLFNSVPIQFITPSFWLSNEMKSSFLKDHPIKVIHNGIDLKTFKPVDSDFLIKFKIINKKVILGCASIWSNRKGLGDFLKLKVLLGNNYQIVLIGLSKEQMKELPDGILGITRTESVEELAAWYSLAEVFVNPTYQDNFPTTNIEALACGTPVITYDTGGSPEAIDLLTGRVVEKGDVNGLKQAIEQFAKVNQTLLKTNCRKRAELLFDKNNCYLDYLNIYESIVENNKI